MKKLALLLVIIFSKAISAQVFTHEELSQKLGYNPNIFENQILSEKEQDSLASYISLDDPLYEDVNGYLRGTTSEFWYYSSTSEIDKQVELMDRSIEKLPALPKNLILFRGQTLGYRKNKPFEKGEMMTDKAYWSTTTSIKSAEAFASGSGVVFVIYSTQKEFKGAVLNEKESEVLLPRNTHLRVMEVRNKGYLQFALVQACETKDSCEKIIDNPHALTFWNQLHR